MASRACGLALRARVTKLRTRVNALARKVEHLRTAWPTCWAACGQRSPSSTRDSDPTLPVARLLLVETDPDGYPPVGYPPDRDAETAAPRAINRPSG